MATTPTQPVGVVSPAPVASPATLPDTADNTRAYQVNFTESQADTLLLLGTHRYWLHLSQIAASTKPLEYAPATLASKFFAAPSDTAWRAHRVRGYEGTYTFALRDSARRAGVFNTKLHKRDFLHTNKGELLTLSEPEFQYMGYSSGLKALVFVAYFGLPYSDVIDRTALLLDARSGQVKGTYRIGSASFEAIDCDPQVAPGEQAILTCAGQLLRAGQPPLSLKRPHAEVRAARFLTDTTMLVVYEFGDYRPVPPQEEFAPDEAASMPVAGAPVTAQMAQPPMEFVSTPAQRRLPNAIVLSTSGRQLATFHYDGWLPDMGYSMPRHAVAASRTYYFLNGENGKPKSLLLLSKARPDSVIQLPLKTFTKFQPPRRRQEVKFVLSDGTDDCTFYADSANPRHIRYARRPAGN
ncbi:hypothetical protein [Hymenobacter bucti]|uniref:Uncharacterized protein n=1 Tax=Hymenobacter bucti TaxID=1844114 RepID=A0ABW4QSD9_9BACT